MDIDTPSVDMEALATSTACYDLDLWPPESNQVRGLSIFPVNFHLDCSSRSWDIMVTRSVRMNGWSGWQPKNMMPSPTKSGGKGGKRNEKPQMKTGFIVTPAAGILSYDSYWIVLKHAGNCPTKKQTGHTSNCDSIYVHAQLHTWCWEDNK